MSWWEAVVLGLVQGFTEFLPISSSGHLVLGRELLGIGPEEGTGILFEALVHFGTAMSILFVYRTEVLELTSGFFGGLFGANSVRDSWNESDSFRTAVLILITVVPTALTYLLLGEAIEEAFTEPRFTAGMLLVTGTLLILTRLRKEPRGDVTAVKAFVIGVAQSLAMFPGISRSGATICAGIYQNVNPERATNFSFLMLLPVVIAGAALKVSEALATEADIFWGPIIIGAVVAFVSGVAAIRIMLEFVRKGRLEFFAVYCFIVGGLGLALL